jgi:hypothetical protein
MRIVSEALKGNLKAASLLLDKEPEIARQARPVERVRDKNDPDAARRAYFQLIKDSRGE